MSVNRVSQQTSAGKLTHLRSPHACGAALSKLRLFFVPALVLTFLVFLSATASAATAPGVAWTVSLVAQPTNLVLTHGGLEEPLDRYVLLLTNTGSVPSAGPVTVTDTLPAGVTVGGVIESAGWTCSAGKGSAFVSCSYEGVVGALGQSPVLTIPVAVTASGTLTNTVTVSGGGAPVATTTRTTQAGSPAPPFGFLDFSSQASSLSGAPDTQAADHPYALTTTLDFPQMAYASDPGHPEKSVGNAKGMEIDLPAGLIGNPQAASRCTIAAVFAETCPPSSRVGAFFTNLAQVHFVQQPVGQIYNVVPEHGYPAEFALFAAAVNRAVFLYVTVNPAPAYNIHISLPDIPASIGGIDNAVVTFFGDPQGMDRTGNSPIAFFTNPGDCSGPPLVTKIEADTWEEPNHWVKAQATAQPVAGCNLLQFQPAFSLQPESTRADEPSGYTFDLGIPQAPPELEQLATPYLKNTTVTLPPGVSISPAAADGLAGCPAEGPEAINLTQAGSGHCPLASQVGEAEALTPVLEKPLRGHVYVAQPVCGGEGQEPCSEADAQNGRLFSLYLQLEGSGITIKLHGTVSANPSTGQLTATFNENPQAPVSELKLSFTGGPRAPLANPATCGTATTTADITPWSAPETADAFPVSLFAVTGCEGFAFAPSFSAGTTTTNAGAYTNFTATFTRTDRQQNLDAIQVTTPPGLLGMLSHVTLCQEPQAAQGTCPGSSQIGSVTAAVGAGSDPFWVQGGRAYLTGPYRGAPFGLSIVVPAVAGPFNLGNVVVRAAITIDPLTSQITVTSDQLPQILDGVPLRIQTVNVTVNRPQFMFNPTNCEAHQITGTLASAQGATATVSSPFAAAGCRNLPFKPDFTAKTSGKTSKTDGASLSATLSYPATPVGAGQASSQANIRSVKVELPKQLPSRLTTLQKACTAAQFNSNPAGCPAASVVGQAVVHTPVLPVALVGPAFFVSHGGEAFPALVVVLQGYGVTVQVQATTFISKKGVTSLTFKAAPDAPFSSFELTSPQGRYSALAANGNLCTEASKLVMPTTLVGQNGATFNQDTPIAVTGCAPAITVVKHSVKGRTATLVVSVPAAGKLTATARGLSKATKTSKGASTVTVKLTLNNGEVAVLKKHPGRKLAAKVNLTFTPKKGSKLKTSVTVLVG